MKQQMSLRIPKEMKQKLENIAIKNGYSLNSLIMFIINDYLKNEKENK